ncbi:Protein of unknown function [Bacillus toyonensis]|jgi:signal transduction histidine kinase
MIL